MITTIRITMTITSYNNDNNNNNNNDNGNNNDDNNNNKLQTAKHIDQVNSKQNIKQ